jgi:hypothetical protein
MTASQQFLYQQTAILLVAFHRIPPPKESKKGVLRESLLVGKHSGSSQLRHSSWVTARAIVVVSSRPDGGQRQTFVGQRRYWRCAVAPPGTEAIETASWPKKVILIWVSTSTGLPCT